MKRGIQTKKEHIFVYVLVWIPDPDFASGKPVRNDRWGCQDGHIEGHFLE